MLRGLAVLLVFQLAGEVLTHLFALPLPGPVVGMVLLLLALELRLPGRDGIWRPESARHGDHRTT